MADQFVARPSSVLEGPGLSSARGINRSHLTLYLSIAAIILSVASAGVHLFIFFNGEQQKMRSEAALNAANLELVHVQTMKEQALARAAQFDAALKQQELKTSAANEQAALAAKGQSVQTTAKLRNETQITDVTAKIQKVAIEPNIPWIADSVSGRYSSNPDGLLGVPKPNWTRTPVSGSRGSFAPDAVRIANAAREAEPELKIR
jgi:hypothetical protein